MKPIRPRYIKIQRLVEELLEKHSAITPPIPVWQIAEAEGAEVTLREFNNEVSGLLLRTGSSSIIAVEKSQSKNRQRFTIAHELGHLLLHTGKELRVDTAFRVNLRSPESSKAEDVEEIESNSFAASLLMPEAFIQRDVGNLVLDIEDTERVQELANRYEVSTQAMTIRLLNLLSLGRI